MFKTKRWIKKITLLEFLVFLFIIGVISLAIMPTSDPDSYWHIKTGEYIVMKGEIPHHDPFSFTGLQLNLKWVAHEWLSDIVFYYFYSWGGEIALSFLKCSVISLTLYFHYQILVLRIQNKSASLLLSGTSLLFMGPFFVTRPQIFTYLLLAILVYLLEKRVEGSAGRRSLLWVPLLFALWVNLHGGAYIIGFVVIFFYFVFGKGDRKEWVGLVALSLTFVLLNPYHLHMILYPLQVMGNQIMVDSIEEWFSPDFHGWYGKVIFAEMFLSLFLMVCIPEKKKPMDVALLFFFLFMALTSRRHMALYFLLSPIYIAPYLYASLQSLGRRPLFRALFLHPDKRYVYLASLLALLFPIILYMTFSKMPPLMVDKKEYPVEAVEWMKKQGLRGNILNHYAWGGYLIHQLWPDAKVYIDGRADIFLPIYNDSPVYEENLDLVKGRISIHEVTGRYPIDYALFPADFYLNLYLKEEEGWTKIREDQTSVLWKYSLVE